MVVWKYEIDNDDGVIEMQKGAQILSVQTQERKICLWALVNPIVDTEERRFVVFGTGERIESNIVSSLKFIGTAQVGIYVWHVFERI